MDQSPQLPSSSSHFHFELTREIYDLYCCLLNSAAKSHRSESILTPFPTYFIKKDSSTNNKKDFDHLRKTLSLMPQSDLLFNKNNSVITFNTKTSDLPVCDLNSLLREWIEKNVDDNWRNNIASSSSERQRRTIDHNNDGDGEIVVVMEDVVALMEFIVRKQQSKKFSVHKITYQDYIRKNSSKQQLLMKPDHIFELKYHSDEFDRKSLDFYTGFHGSSIENFYSIITNSLQNYSGTELMRTGNAFGNGIYLCEDVRVARDFSKGAVIDWKNSTLGSYLSAVVQCKVVGKPHYALQQEKNVRTTTDNKNRYLIVNRSEDVRIQYVLLFSHFKNEKELENSKKFSYGMIYVYIILLLALIIGNYWKDIKRELKRHF